MPFSSISYSMCRAYNCVYSLAYRQSGQTH
jgi:hypothetical protein